jgi:hypothetical protein
MANLPGLTPEVVEQSEYLKTRWELSRELFVVGTIIQQTNMLDLHEGFQNNARHLDHHTSIGQTSGPGENYEDGIRRSSSVALSRSR